MKDLRRRFERVFGAGAEVRTYFAPGRVCFLGDHLDYNGGTVLSFALPMGVYAAARTRDDDLLRLYSEHVPDCVVEHRRQKSVEIPWSRYPVGVYERLDEILPRGESLPGADLYYASTLPVGAGLSSSAALEVVTAFALLHPRLGSKLDRIEVARLCKRVENDFVGVNCGVMDQFSVALARKDQFLRIDCSDESHDFVASRLENTVVVVMNSNVPRALRESKYNQRRGECEAALAALRESGLRLRFLAEARPEHASQADLPAHLQRRVRYVAEEQARVRECVAALERGDAFAVGKLMNHSHEGLKNLYEVTGKHLDALCDAARQAEGCYGARMTGAGFGGCAVALVAAGAENDFIARVRESYRRQTQVEPEFYCAVPCDGARPLDQDRPAAEQTPKSF
ncbi:MAG: galactokinase [Bacteroidia bacterium]|nr:galactokinase [Bacteroidia bacterium]MDW8333373.1 galactokinase [Bacteroidia bacterium]